MPELADICDTYARIFEGLPELPPVPDFSLGAGMLSGDPLDGNGSVFWRKEPGGLDFAGNQPSKEAADDDSHASGNDHGDSPARDRPLDGGEPKQHHAAKALGDDVGDVQGGEPGGVFSLSVPDRDEDDGGGVGRSC